jgi:hypothetical protein
VSQITTIGLDIAKNVFHAHGVDERGAIVFSRKLTWGKLLDFFAGQPTCMVALEACGGAHHWARELQAMGHDVRLIPLGVESTTRCDHTARSGNKPPITLVNRSAVHGPPSRSSWMTASRVVQDRGAGHERRKLTFDLDEKLGDPQKEIKGKFNRPMNAIAS